jgi:predicted RNase H-like nuclease (RuvC/YqgF family)
MDEKTDEQAPLNPGQMETANVNVENSSDPSGKLTPEHPRFKQVLEERNTLRESLTELKEELASLKESINSRQTREDSDELTPDEISALEKIDRQMKARGYVTKEQLESTTRQQKNALELEKLETKFDGQNGYPRFDSVEVMEFARKRGINNFEDAYYLLHKPAIIQVEAKKSMAGFTPPTSEKPGRSEKQSPAGEFTRDSISEMSVEDYMKNRDKIHNSLRGK